MPSHDHAALHAWDPSPDCHTLVVLDTATPTGTDTAESVDNAHSIVTLIRPISSVEFFEAGTVIARLPAPALSRPWSFVVRVYLVAIALPQNWCISPWPCILRCVEMLPMPTALERSTWGTKRAPTKLDGWVGGGQIVGESTSGRVCLLRRETPPTGRSGCFVLDWQLLRHHDVLVDTAHPPPPPPPPLYPPCYCRIFPPSWRTMWCRSPRTIQGPRAMTGILERPGA
ncbi:hypothetical protein C8F01DRAFT_1244143 [Mycena amicta]|nr:hypothetical protein C8F01DRAFT_1244143 [Mycena amicta]